MSIGWVIIYMALYAPRNELQPQVQLETIGHEFKKMYDSKEECESELIREALKKRDDGDDEWTVYRDGDYMVGTVYWKYGNTTEIVRCVEISK